MPRMDGITFLRKIMDERPTPWLSARPSPKAARDHDSGACGRCRRVVTKPKVGLKAFLQEPAEN